LIPRGREKATKGEADREGGGYSKEGTETRGEHPPPNLTWAGNLNQGPEVGLGLLYESMPRVISDVRGTARSPPSAVANGLLGKRLSPISPVRTRQSEQRSDNLREGENLLSVTGDRSFSKPSLPKIHLFSTTLGRQKKGIRARTLKEAD